MLIFIYICRLLSWVCSDYLPTCVHNIFPTIMGAHLVSSQIQVLDDLPHFSTCIIDNKLQGTKKTKQKRVFRRRKVGNVFKKVNLERGVPPSGANLQRSIWKAPNSVKAIYRKILLLFVIISSFAMIFQLFVILNKVSKSAEIAFLEFQLLILQEMEHGNIFFSVEIFSKIFAILKLAQRFKKSSLKMRQSSSLNPSLNMKQGLLNNSLYCSWSSSLQSTTNPLLKMSAKHF